MMELMGRHMGENLQRSRTRASASVMHTHDRLLQTLSISIQERGHDAIYPAIQFPDLRHAGTAPDFQQIRRQLQSKIAQPVKITAGRMFQQMADRLSGGDIERDAKPDPDRSVQKIEQG